MRKRFCDLKVGDTFRVEFGAYGNYTNAELKAIRPTETEQVVEIDYTIPFYYGDKILTARQLLYDFI